MKAKGCLEPLFLRKRSHFAISRCQSIEEKGILNTRLVVDNLFLRKRTHFAVSRCLSTKGRYIFNTNVVVTVIPAKAGIQICYLKWIPACAGMTDIVRIRCPHLPVLTCIRQNCRATRPTLSCVHRIIGLTKSLEPIHS